MRTRRPDRASRRPGEWPGGKRFAFTIFDDTDDESIANGPAVYEFLGELGMRITKSVWTCEPEGDAPDEGASCEDPGYLAWVLSLQRAGHEIALHNVARATSEREHTRLGLDRFREQFGADPRAHANHAQNREGIYHGEARVTGWRRAVYNALTRRRRRRFYEGHVPGSPFFWGDLCHERVTYVRNFVYRDINTLKACPYAPYHDSARPYVRHWFASAEGSSPELFLQTISEQNQQRLEDEGGLCIMYTHFGYGFAEEDRLHPGFERSMRQMAQRDGWFAPVSTVLDHIRASQGDWQIDDRERSALERRWLLEKVRSHRTS